MRKTTPPPALARAIAAAGNQSCTREILDAAVLEGRSPDTNGWFALTLAGVQDPVDVDVIETGWRMCSESSRADVLDVVLSRCADPARTNFDDKACDLLVGLAGLRRMETLADTLMARAREMGSHACAINPVLSALDGFACAIENKPAWAKFCLVRRGWDASVMPKASAILASSRQAEAFVQASHPRPAHRRVRA